MQDTSSLVVGPADSSQGVPVAWEARYIDPVEGPGRWHPIYEENLDVYRDRKDQEVRALYTTPPPSSPQVAVADIDWPEDRQHENGNYSCACVHCGRHFIGHKRRVCCKLCAQSAPKAAEPLFTTSCSSLHDANWPCAICGTPKPAPDEPRFTVSMYGTAQAADKAREEWLAAKVEPQARHWRQAVLDYDKETQAVVTINTGLTDGSMSVAVAAASKRRKFNPDAAVARNVSSAAWIEQRARSLAQAEQVAKGEG